MNPADDEVRADSALILDPWIVRDLIEKRKALGIDHFDEVWEGRLVVPPPPDNEHQRLSGKLAEVFATVIDRDRGDEALFGGNVSDRDDWTNNYRVCDGLVVLASGKCQDRKSHWFGGPDLVVEILSPVEKKFEKFDFYSKIGTRELLLVGRNPWSVELFRLIDGRLLSAGASTVENPQWITSQSLPLTFRLLPGKDRPMIEAVHTDDGRRWAI